MKEVNILFNKKLVLIGLTLSISFMLIGLSLVLLNLFPETQGLSIYSGLLLIVVFGFLSFILYKNIIFKKPALTVNMKGIIDNTTIVKFGLIQWDDIIEIKEAEYFKSKILLIHVKNPEKYLQNINIKPNSYKNNYLKLATEMFKTPIFISSKNLKCSFTELSKLLIESHKVFNESKIQ